MKKFVLTVTDDGKVVNCASEVQGFNTMEMIGILEWKLRDIFKQIDEPDEFTRKRINEDGTVDIVEEVQV